MTEFCVRSNNFKTYEKFAKFLRKIGYVYSDPNFKFYESCMLFSNCLIMSDKMDQQRTLQPKYRFSNIGEDDTLIFNLDTQSGFNTAVTYAQLQFDIYANLRNIEQKGSSN